MDWQANAQAIRELWPEAAWNDALRSMFMQELEPLDQAALSEAIRLVRKSYTSQQPEVKWILTAYAEVQNARRLAAKKPTPPVERCVIADTDETQEQRLFREWMSVIDSAAAHELNGFGDKIIKAMDSARLSAKTAYLLLATVNKRMESAA